MDWKYLLFSFEGRINRKPFWLTLLALTVITMIVEYALFALFGVSMVPQIDPNAAPDAVQAAIAANTSKMLPIVGILSLLLLWPNLALYTKRWHDRNKSGWWTLILIVPFIGALWILIECGFLCGTSGPNRFGQDPLA